MGFIKFNNTPKHQKFNYIPRYYDAAKEDLHNRVKAASGEASDSDVSKARIKAGLRRRYAGREIDTSAAVRKSNIRLFLIIAFLLIAGYMFLSSASLQRMIEAFLK